MVDDTAYLLEQEMQPLRSCISNKNHKVLAKVWRKLPVWESCHFYKLIEEFIDRKDESDGVMKFFSPREKAYINHFYEPRILE